MSILCDTQLSREIQMSQPLVSGVDPNDYGRWDSAIQPASLDLTIGTILVPGRENGHLGSPSKALTCYALEQGQTAVIKTHEKLNVPPYLAGIGFPPSSVFMKGVLMTNPGHVDPGFLGQLKFTVINIGKLAYELRAGDPICTILFFRIDPKPSVDWISLDSKTKPPKGDSDSELLARLSADFLDINERAKQEAERTVKDLDIRIKHRQVAVPVIAALIAASASVVIGLWKPWDEPISKLDGRVGQLEKQLDVKTLTGNLKAFERRLNALEANAGKIKK